MRRSARVDNNHAEIVRVLRRAQCRVLDLSRVGFGCPDLLVYSPYVDRLLLVEVKDGSKPPSKQALTTAQRAFHSVWHVSIVTCPETALGVVGAV